MVNTYQINIRHFHEEWFEKIVAQTLDMYLRGEDLTNSPLTKKGREFAKHGLWHRDCNGVWDSDRQNYEECFRAREKALVELYEDMKVSGYNGSVVTIKFREDGSFKVYDGQHRIAVMKYLGINADVNVQAGYDTNDWDFPLVDVLLKTDRVGRQTYQPVYDRRITAAQFGCDRNDSYSRLDYLLTRLVGTTVLDIGCSEGYFAMELAKRGYKVVAIDADKNKAAITRYLSIINNIDIDVQNVWMSDYFSQNPDAKFDNILMFSVFHNTVATMGEEKAYADLALLADKTHRLFFEYPNTNERYWVDHHRDAPIHGFVGAEFKQSIANTVNLEIIDDAWRKYRPLMTLGRNGSSVPHRELIGIEDAEWERHSKWEANWWVGCTNTLDEQLKQEKIYMPYMKLNKYGVHRMWLDMKGRSILDIGGGPVSILLRVLNHGKLTVVDPCDYPEWVAKRYEQAGIEYIREKAETVNLDYDKYDEAWCYNVLQHVQDPVKVINTMRKYARKIRVFEPLEIGTHKGHPHNLTQAALDDAFGKHGLVDHVSDGQIYYYGVFNYD